MLSSDSLYEPNESSPEEIPSSDELSAFHQAFQDACKAAPVKSLQRKEKLTLTLVVRHNIDNLYQLKKEKNYTYEDMAAMLMKAYPFLKQIKATSLKTILHRELARKDSPKNLSPSLSSGKSEKGRLSSPKTAPNHDRFASPSAVRDPRRISDDDFSQVVSRSEFNLS
jgi:hypothetical protein